MASKENLNKAQERRVRRTLNDGGKLKVVGADPNYVYRIVNVRDDRVQTFIEAGWEHAVEDTVRVGDSRVDEHSALGLVRMISVGGGDHAVLLKIRRDYYEEDQAAKQEYLLKTEAAMRPNSNDGTYGKVELSRK